MSEWDKGCGNSGFHPDGAEFYPSLHAALGGFRRQFDVGSIALKEVLLTFGTLACPRLFRVYIPAGSTRINMNFFNPNGALIGVVSRFQRPPQLNYCAVRASNFSTLPWSGPGVLSQLADKDHQVQNMGGSFFPLVQVIRGDGLAAGDWLYFKVMDLDDENDIFQFQYVVMVNKATYLAWFNNPQTKWDASQDPLPLVEEGTNVEPAKVTIQGPATAEVGSQAVYTAVGAGGTGKYQFCFWISDGLPAWNLVQQYSGFSTYTWQPAKPGTYRVGVWVRTPGGDTPDTQHEMATSMIVEVTQAAPTQKAMLRIDGRQLIITLPEGVSWEKA